MAPVFINKYVFEPNYNGLKSRVQNHYYFGTNLTLQNRILKSVIRRQSRSYFSFWWKNIIIC